jgi:hypothetical protein
MNSARELLEQMAIKNPLYVSELKQKINKKNIKFYADLQVKELGDTVNIIDKKPKESKFLQYCRHYNL